MRRFTLMASLFLGACLLTSSTGLIGQEPKQAEKKEVRPAPKTRTQLPMFWGQIGLSDEQKKKVYAIQIKNMEEIDILEEQIKALKEKSAKERLEVLTPDQKKKLEEIIKAKVGG